MAQNMWWLSSLQGVPVDAFGANFCTITPGSWGTAHPQGRNGHRMKIRDISSLFLPPFCAKFLSLCSLPTQSRVGAAAAGTWRLLVQEGSGVEVVWGKRRELITNSSLGGWYLHGEIIFFKLPQSLFPK